MTESSNAGRMATSRISESNSRGSAALRPRDVIFINQYSTDRVQKKHGPGRRVIGAYVQRAIHSRKRLESIVRLKSSTKNSTRHGSCSAPQQQRPLAPAVLVGAYHGLLTERTSPEDHAESKEFVATVLP